MVINIADIKKGDEIIVAGPRGTLMYIKVLRPPAIAKDQGYYPKLGWTKYTGVRGTTNKEDIVNTYTWTDHTGQVRTSSWTKKNPICTPDGHNEEKSYDLNRKTIWLVKREETL